MNVHRLFEKHLGRWIKAYSVLPLIFMFSFNSLIYWATMHLCRDWHHYDLTLSIDRAVPLVPEFVFVYLGCYAFWAANYIMSAWFGKDEFYKFTAADISSRVVCLLFFICLPTTNIRPELVGDSLSMQLLKWLYSVDLPVNLFPSIHCLVSWFSYIAIRGRKEIPAWYRGFSCFFALLVAASTQFLKQHYIVDAIGGILLAEGMYRLSCRYQYYGIIKKCFENINCKLKGILIKWRLC